MPKMEGIKRVLVIGSGPIVIGQAAEFDYAGTQACRSLKEEGMEVILVNSNPATIMTDKDIADKVYIEPLTTEVLQHIIEVEKPDSLLPNMGGQAGLNLGMELAESGFLDSHGVKLLGTTAETIRNAEGRQEFKDLMERIGEPCASSELVENIEDGIEYDPEKDKKILAEDEVVAEDDLSDGYIEDTDSDILLDEEEPEDSDELFEDLDDEGEDAIFDEDE